MNLLYVVLAFVGAFGLGYALAERRRELEDNFRKTKWNIPSQYNTPKQQ